MEFFKILTGIKKRLLAEKSPHRLPWVTEKKIKHQDFTSLKSHTFYDGTFYYKNPLEFLHMYHEIIECKSYDFVSQSSSPVIIECGANIGMATYFFAKNYTTATIVAFEPDKFNFELLQKNVLENNLKNVTIRQEAVWKWEGEISFDSDGTESSKINESKTSETVKCIRLKDILGQYSKIDFLKVDIEGAEYEVIQDCQEELKLVDHLFLEYHGHANTQHELLDLLQWVKNAGFTFYLDSASALMSSPFAEKTSVYPYDLQLNIFCYRI